MTVLDWIFLVGLILLTIGVTAYMAHVIVQERNRMLDLRNDAKTLLNDVQYQIRRLESVPYNKQMQEDAERKVREFQVEVDRALDSILYKIPYTYEPEGNQDD